MTVSCRRSAEDVRGTILGDSGEPVASAAPQFAQNVASGKLQWPHERHARDSGAPHWMQNLLPSGTSALQPGQSCRTASPRTDKGSAKAIGVAWCRRQFCPKTFRLGRQHHPSLRARRIALASKPKIEYQEARYATISEQGNSVTL
jgi:hypothetical protein